MSVSTNSELINLLLNRLGRRNDQALRVTVVDELNMTKNELERGRFLPWFLLDNTALSVVAGTAGISLPTDFLREEDDHQPELVYNSGTKWLLDKGVYDVLQKKYLNTESGRPKYYAITGNSLVLFPTPSENFTLNFFYYKAQESIVDDAGAVVNPWLLAGMNWLFGETGYVVASFHVQKPEMASRFRSAAMKAMDDLNVQHEARQHVNMNYSDDSEYQTGS